MMGGLINSSTVKGDLWMVEAGGADLACYPLATHAEGPGPRVGHASLLVGNAFIVYGGDTKMDDGDVLDEALYLLNTSTRQWSRAVPAAPRPPGRYGHSLNIMGSKIYVFGGQVEGYFMNDLVAFDLNQLQNPQNRWEFLIQNEGDGAIVPPPRTNHTIITYNDCMYLFGGTNGYQWFNDVWCYDPVTNTWAELPCIGYIPASREGHAAALVDDVMYIFGGRTEEGADLGDLAAFRITTRRWYTFQNMGPSPSPRSGHSMTAHGKQIIVMGGEPSTATREATDLSIAYLLDTTKIRYPDKPSEPQPAQQPQEQGQPMNRRPSDPERRMGPLRNQPPRDGLNGPHNQMRMNGAPPRASVMGPPNMMGGRPNGPNGNDVDGPLGQHQQGPQSNLPMRASAMQAPAGPPPAGQAPSRPNGLQGPPGASGPPPQGQPPMRPTGPQGQGGIGPRGKPPVSNRGFGPAVDTSIRSASRERDGSHGSLRDTPSQQGRRTPTSATTPRSAMRQDFGEPPTPSEGVLKDAVALQRTSSKNRRQQGSLDGEGPKSPTNRSGSPPPPTRQGSNAKPRSARNSQTVNLLKELDNLKNRNAWMASELELARKSGYTPAGTPSSIVDNRISTSFSDSERPLIEALIAMRNELSNIQASVDQQAILAAKKIAEVEKQRDSAISEAVYAKAKFAAHGGASQPGTPLAENSRETFSRTGDRSQEVSKKLAIALSAQRDLQTQAEHYKNEIEAEKCSRRLADDTTKVAQARIAELESYKQQNTSQVESLKAELHQVQMEAREEAARCAEAVAKAQLLEIDKEGSETQLKELLGDSKDHHDTFDSLREALSSSHAMKDVLQRKLDEERTRRDVLEQKLRRLRTEHEECASELETATAKLQDAEEMAEKHVAEAESLRRAVLSGLDRASSRNASMSPTAGGEKLAALQQQIETANALVRKYQAAADAASQKLRGAEERIAGLEAYQEQVSREGMSIRKQLQSSMREVQTLQAANGDMKARIGDHTRETNALNLQYSTLKNLLQERGISPSSAAMRGVHSPNEQLEQNRVRELEQQLLNSQQDHEETKQLNAAHLQEIERAYQEKLSQLESDYQSAVHYVKGTEKMLKRMKDDLSNANKVNSKLRAEVEEVRAQKEADGDAEADWEEERKALRKQISDLQTELKQSHVELGKQLEDIKKELARSKEEKEALTKDHENMQRQLSDSFEHARSDLDQLQEENNLLEQRALDAEQKVSLLLDQVENSVDSYRRQSHLINDPAATKTHTRNTSAGESETGDSVYSDATARGGDRNSMALDTLASELETLRSHWQSTNKNYRQSQISTFEFETPAGEETEAQSMGESIGGEGNEENTPKEPSTSVQNSLTDWRKQLDAEDRAHAAAAADSDDDKSKTSTTATHPTATVAPLGPPQGNVI